MAISPATPLEAPQPPRVPQTPSVESVLCYRTVGGAQLAARAQAIANALSTVGKASSAEGAFFITPDQRRISYINNIAMFGAPIADLPASADAAENRARQCVQEINSALGNAGVLAAMKVTALLPDGLKLLGATPVYHPDTLAIDHWRCNFQPTIRSSVSMTEVEVSDTCIEVRIGAAGRMIAFVAQWRPITQSIIAGPAAPPDPRDLAWTSQASVRAGTGAVDGTDSGGPTLIYASFENGVGETQLLPYYVFADDPLARRYPAAQGMTAVLPATFTSYG